MAVEPDHVYVIPPNARLAVHKGRLNVLHQEESAAKGHKAIDHFFRFLAEDVGGKASTAASCSLSRRPVAMATSSRSGGGGVLNSAELLETLAALEARTGGDALLPTFRHLIHDLQVHQTELEAQNEELREAQLALELSRNRYASLYDSAPIGYLSLSQHGQILEINLTGASMLGRMPAALIDYPFVRFVAEEDRQRFLEHVSRCRKSGRDTVDLGIVPRGGEAFQGQLFCVAVNDADHGRVYLATLSDITERKRMEEALQRAPIEMEARVEERTAELSVAVRALEDAHQRKDEFLAVLGHELRNPLASLVTTAYLLQVKGPEDRDTFAWATETIRSQVEQLRRLIDDLLDVSRVSRGKIALRKKCLSLPDVVTQTVEAYRPKVEQQQLHLSLNLPRQPVWVEADAARLTQVVANLLDNAVKFTPPGGRINLALETAEDAAVIRVRDSGEGIAPELLPHIFESFTQGETSLARQGAGLGIGLSLVKGLVAMHGGWVSATSEGIGKGAQFEVHLPALKEAPAVRGADEGKHRGPAAHARRILLAEDNIAAAEALAELLRHFGHAITVTHDGAAALAAGRGELPEVAILDIGLPEMDGYELARALRALPGGEGPLLVALTGYGGDADRLQSRAAGFDHHLVKPASVDDLLKLIDAWDPATRTGRA
jgi:two-component system CheB/CheR fusion protein